MPEATRSATPLDALATYFGHPSFRPGQEEIIASAMAGNDTLVVMPTGGGKSLCYQIPALLLDGVTVVVSPLIALMKDQVDALARRGVRATTINSSLSVGEVRQRMTDLRYGLYRLVYVAPERFESRIFLDLIADIRVSLFAVDEAHCISEWGHDFRPSYLKLREAAEALGRPPIIALTATATPYVQEDIVSQLALKAPRRFVRGFDRPNLSYIVRQSADKGRDLRAIMSDTPHGGSTIIYAGTRRRVEEMGTMLHAERLPVTIYHAGLRDPDRRAAQEAFISGQATSIVATNAFGMGIDKANVRRVIHVDMPGSIEGYYQEAGRAGRDSLPSDCILLYGDRDRSLQEFFIRSSFPDREQIESLYDALWDLVHVGVGNRYEGVFVPDMKTLAARSRIHPAALTSTLGVLEQNGILRKVRSDRLGMVRIVASSQEIQEYYRRTRDADRQKTIVALLRTLGGAALGQPTMFSPDDVASRHELTPEAFERGMRALMLAGLVSYTPPTPGTGYQFLTERLPSRRMAVDEKAIEAGRERSLLKLEAMERYVRTTGCRRDFILEYFHAEHEPQPCGRCDTCRNGTSAIAGALALPTVRRAANEMMESVGENGLRPRVNRAIELILAACDELGGRYGKMTIIDVLRGGRSNTIERFDLDRYHRYGELKDMERGELSRIADALLEQRLMESSASLHPTVRITDAGRGAIAHLTRRPFAPAPAATASTVSRNPELLKRLRGLRDEAAEREGVSPERYCPDSILTAISNTLPRTRSAFLEIEGTNEELYATLGAAVLTTVERELAGDRDDVGEIPDRLRRTLSLARQGYTLREIAHRSAMQPSTISTQLEELIVRGVAIDIDRHVSGSILRQVRDALAAKPSATLRELRGLTGNSIEFPELRVAMAWVKRKG